MSVLEDDYDMFGLSSQALGDWVGNLGGSIPALQLIYRNYGTLIINSDLFGGFLVKFLQDKATFLEKLNNIGITVDFHQEMIYRRFQKEKEKRDQRAALMVPAAGAASDKAPCDHPPNKKRGVGRPRKILSTQSVGQRMDEESDNGHEEDHVDSSLSSVSSSRCKLQVPKQKRRRLINKEDEDEMEGKAGGGASSSGMVTIHRTQQKRRMGRQPTAVECLDPETGEVVKLYPSVKGNYPSSLFYRSVFFLPNI